MSMPEIQQPYAAVKEILEDCFGIGQAEIGRLVGYEDRNYLVTCDRGRFVLKIYQDDPNRAEELSEESRLLDLLAERTRSVLPRPVPGTGGKAVHRVDFEGEKRIARLLTYVEGDVLDDRGFSVGAVRELGELLANIDLGLSGQRSTALEARQHGWDLKNYGLSRRFLNFISDSRDRKYVEYFFFRAKEFVDPAISDLRHGLIHGDANERNMVRAGDGRLSLIDFGDMCHTALVNEVAIAASYSEMFSDEPLSLSSELVGAYSSKLPLLGEEVALLYDLIALRLCVSVCNSARARTEDPANEYALISEEKAWLALRRWAALNPLRAENEFRKAAGLEARPAGDGVEELGKRKSNTSSSLSLQFREPIRMRSAAFQYMFDAEGRRYLDCYNNIPHVGHCHPKVADAIAKASITLNTNTRYLTREFNDFTTKLLARFPAPLSKVFLVNSGSAATDLALRLAAAHTGRDSFIVTEHGYHGNTRSGIAVSHYKYAGKGGPGGSSNVLEAPIPDVLRPGDDSRDFFADLKDRIARTEFEPAAFIAEPIVGCGGQVPLPEGYLKKVYGLVREMGGVCISDEVQTGFGRLGSWFWGFEMHGVVPDIVVLGKPIGNGHPLAAVVTTPEIARSFETGMEFFSSFGGNTVSCAAGSAVLEVVDEERLQQNAAGVGGFLMEGLRDLVNRFSECEDARGAGLFLGLEFSAENRMPNTGLAARVKDRLRQRGILVGTDGPHDNVIKIKPPLCFSQDNAQELLASLEEAIAEG